MVQNVDFYTNIYIKSHSIRRKNLKFTIKVIQNSHLKNPQFVTLCTLKVNLEDQESN